MDYWKEILLVLAGAAWIGQVIIALLRRNNARAEANLTSSQSESTSAEANKINVETSSLLMKQMSDRIEELTADNRMLRETQARIESELREIKGTAADQEETIQELKSEIDLLRRFHLKAPFPQWIKDKNLVMLDLNRAYEKDFLLIQGKTKQDYVGKDDVHVWGKKIGLTYQQNDRLGIKDPRGYWMGIEPIPHTNKHYLIVKYPVYDSSQNFSGFGGFSLEIDQRLMKDIKELA